MVDTLHSRVVTLLCDLSQTRERFVFRQQLASQEGEQPHILQNMVTLFGEEPKNEENETKKEQKNQENEENEQKYWIENITNDISFEIHSDCLIPLDSSVFVSSDSSSFESRISTNFDKEHNFILVSLYIKIDSLFLL